jgi:hypothetical protein
VRLAGLQVVENTPISTVRGGVQSGDIVQGIVVNTGEPAREVTVSVTIDGLVPLAEPLVWPDTQPRFAPDGNYFTYLPELGRNRRAEFRFATRDYHENIWRLNFNIMHPAGQRSDLQNGTVYAGRLFIQEGTSGGKEVWKFSFSIDAGGKATLEKKKARWGSG